MAMRNGIVADTLRMAGLDCFSIIFGLNLPQIKQIAALYEKLPELQRMELADELMADKAVRESRLLAIHIYGSLPLPPEKMKALIKNMLTREEAEVLNLRVARALPYATEILAWPDSGNPHEARLKTLLASAIS